MVDGKILLDKKLAKLKLNIKRFFLGDEKKPFVSVSDKRIPAIIEFKDDITISLPSLKIDFRISKKNKSTAINIKDIKLLKAYLKNLPISVSGGNIKIFTDNFEHFTFDGTIYRDDCFIYLKEGSCLTRIPISGSFSEENFILKAFGGNLVFNEKKSLLKLHKVNLDLEKFFEIAGKSKSSSISKKMRISATHSNLRYEKYRLLTDRYELGLLPNGDFHFRGNLGRDKVTVSKKNKTIEILADKISDKMLHPLINFKGLQGGRYSLILKGIPGKTMKGEIDIDNGALSNFKAYNNVLAFMNAVPALATFNSPGFSRKGFVINHGIVKFTIYKGELLTFDKVLIKGKSATVSGDGTVNLVTKKINVDLAIQTAKGVGSLIGKLPVVGYILTGKNKSFLTVGLHIGGTLDKPVTKTSPIKDVLLLPFRMIERTFESGKNLQSEDITHF